MTLHLSPSIRSSQTAATASKYVFSKLHCQEKAESSLCLEWGLRNNGHFSREIRLRIAFSISSLCPSLLCRCLHSFLFLFLLYSSLCRMCGSREKILVCCCRLPLHFLFLCTPDSSYPLSAFVFSPSASPCACVRACAHGIEKGISETRDILPNTHAQACTRTRVRTHKRTRMCAKLRTILLLTTPTSCRFMPQSRNRTPRGR